MCVRSEFPPSRQPYIIAMTANAIASDRLICLEAGMDEHLAKPFTAAPPLFGHEPFTHAPLNVAADLAARIAELMAKHLG